VPYARSSSAEFALTRSEP
jgi:hypothetical protein